MGWLDRVDARADSRPGRAENVRRGRVVKAFSMPPFWSDGERVALAVSASVNATTESGGDSFEQYVNSIYKSNGIVYSLIAARTRVFSQVRFSFQRMRNGREGELFGTDALSILEDPWPNGTTAEMAARMEVDASLSGNAFFTTCDKQGRIGKSARPEDGRFIARMRPDWCTLVVRAPSGNPWNVDAYVSALMYRPPGMGNDPLLLTPGEYAHYSPLPDPLARFRGMSWMTPIIRDIRTDDAFTTHKTAFLHNGATPNLVVKVSEDMDDDEFAAFVRKFKDEYTGSRNAHKTLFLAGGADITPVGVDFKALEMTSAQSAVETRLCASSGVPAAIAGISEGLQGSALNAGNFQASRRLMVDSTMRNLWSTAAPSLRPLCPPPGRDARLWYDARDIPFLRDDAKDEAEMFQTLAIAIRSLLDAGYDPDATVTAAKNRDMGALLGQHSGLFSVQLQPAGGKAPTATDTVPANGQPSNGDKGALALAGRSNGYGRG